MATTQNGAFGPLESPIDVDVAVLGAGITGLTTALLLKQTGVRVAVVEAGRVSGATTGHTTAKVTAQHGLIYDTITSKFGRDGARAYGEANYAAVNVIDRIVRENWIECDWEQRPSYAYTEQDSNIRQIEKEVEAAQAAGLPAHYTEQTELPWPVKAAVRFDDQAQFHPRRYCLALAGLIDGDGSRVFEQTRAIDVEEGSPCVVKTDRHDVRAAFVVLATHTPFLDQGGFFAKCHPSASTQWPSRSTSRYRRACTSPSSSRRAACASTPSTAASSRSSPAKATRPAKTRTPWPVTPRSSGSRTSASPCAPSSTSGPPRTTCRSTRSPTSAGYDEPPTASTSPPGSRNGA